MLGLDEKYIFMNKKLSTRHTVVLFLGFFDLEFSDIDYKLPTDYIFPFELNVLYFFT